jgi:hypothetical protein
MSYHRAREKLLNKKRIAFKKEGRSKLYRLPEQDHPPGRRRCLNQQNVSDYYHFGVVVIIQQRAPEPR